MNEHHANTTNQTYCSKYSSLPFPFQDMASKSCCMGSNLCLHPPGMRPSSFPSEDDSAGSSSVPGCIHRDQQPLTILYGEQVCVVDATELQAEAIISMARRELDGGGQRSESIQLTSPALSMKGSLQRFLQKRKSRVGVAVPHRVDDQQLRHYL